MKPTLLVLAAGMGSRYGGLKQVDPVGPNGETLLDYSVFDALRAGFGKVVFVIRKDFEEIFRKSVGGKYEGQAEVAYAFQDITDLPAGYSVPEGRTKPWGTAHAIRAARAVVDGPFAAINADDFYGRDAFARVGEFLAGSRGAMQFAMVGYLLEKTLSENGSVARGVCKTTEDGSLVDVRELTKLIRSGETIENEEGEKPFEQFTGRERVSMNLWGFGRELFDVLEERFPDWLATNATSPKAEWYIPFVVNELVQEKKATVQVLPTESSWFGVTYRDDKPRVQQALRELHSSGEYPEHLW